MLQLQIERKTFLCAVVPTAFRSHICELCLAGVHSTHEIVLGGVKVAGSAYI